MIMTIKQIRNITWVTLLVAFCIFVFVWERKDLADHQESLEQTAVVIAPALWNLDANGPVEYLKLACQLDNYAKITVYAVTDKPFFEIEARKPGIIARTFKRIGLIPLINMETDIHYKGSKIGRISALHYHDTIYTHLYLLLTLGLIALVVQYFSRAVLANQSLEVRGKERTQDLRKSEERLHLALDGADLGMWDWDMTTDKVYFSPRYLSMLGYELNELPNTLATWNNLLHPDDKAWVNKVVLDCLTQEDSNWSIECRLRQKDGTYRWILGRGKVVEYDRNNKPIRAAGTHLDINDQKQGELERTKLEVRLTQAQKMEAIGTLAGGIAHDFNNILTPILGYAEMVQYGLPKESELWANQQEVLNAADRAKNLVKQILAFSRQSEHERKPLQIHLIVKEAIKLLRASIPTTIEIREDIDTKSGTALADPTQIHQILMNLCTNAYHAMRETGGILAVELTQIEIERADTKVTALHLAPGSYLLLKISDTGTGMDRTTVDRIFDPYFTTKKKGEGTGMGLSVVHGIVKSHGGHITVYSEPGQGTSFQIYLPRIATSSTEFEAKLKEDIPLGKERILIVDDEETVVRMEQQMLEHLGYKVTAMINCEEALHAFTAQADDFDLIITDMTMPHMTGAELSQKILAIRPDIPIIMCTGFSELINEDKAKAIGIREYVMKPVVRQEMAKVVRKVLDVQII